MSVLKDKDKKKLLKVLAGMANPVKLTMFTQDFECQSCTLARSLLEEITDLSDMLNLQIKDFVRDSQVSEEYGIERIPAIVVEGEVDYGIRFYGIPGGYELLVFVETIVAVSSGENGLATEAVDLIAKLSQPVRIQVMVGPTCPNCANAVLMANKLAMASEQISCDMIVITEFPQLVNQHNIGSIPTTVINERRRFTGVLPVMEMIREVLRSTSRRREIWPRDLWQ
jgi:glutaredoxin-like protein